MRFVFALFDFMRAHCICCIGEEGFLNSVVERCWRERLEKSVVEKCCREVLAKSVAEKCCSEVL